MFEHFWILLFVCIKIIFVQTGDPASKLDKKTHLKSFFSHVDSDLAASNYSSSTLFEFGLEHGDSVIQRTLDSFEGPIPIATNFSFGGKIFTQFYINKNGFISFLSPVISNIPIPFPAKFSISIAPFWSNIDTLKGQIFHREITDSKKLGKIKSHMPESFKQFDIKWAHLVTWSDVSAFLSTSNKKNTFQVLLASSATSSFTIFNYGKIEWSKPRYSSFYAQAGFNLGDSFRYLTLPGSSSEDVVDLCADSNTGVPGRWIYQVDDPEFLLISCHLNPDCSDFSPRVLYDFGKKIGDKLLTASSQPIDLLQNFTLGGLNFSKFYINVNGLISFESPILDYIPTPFPAESFISIASFWNDIDLSKGGDIYHREVTDNKTLSKISSDIAGLYGNFNQTWSYLITWHKVVPFEQNSGEHNTFQALITSNGSFSYVIFNYEQLDWTMSFGNIFHAQAGVNLGDGLRFLSLTGSLKEDVLNLTDNSNMGLAGRWIYRLDSADKFDCLCDLDTQSRVRPTSVLYEYGIRGKDTFMQIKDLSGFEEIPIRSASFNLFEKKFNKFFINIWGLITFEKDYDSKEVKSFPAKDFICVAAFFSNMNYLDGGYITYREVTDINTKSQIREAIRSISDGNFDVTWAFIITWYHMKAIRNKDDKKNTFQVVLASNGIISYTMFNYEKLEWSKPDSLETFAQAGFNFGDGFRYKTLPGSLSNDILKLKTGSNVKQNGRWIYRVDRSDGFLNVSCISNPECIDFENSVLFEFGPKHGDKKKEINDIDPISVGAELPFLGQKFDKFYITFNGHISFVNRVTRRDPPSLFPLKDIFTITPFWNDIDWDRVDVFHRQIDDENIRRKINSLITKEFGSYTAAWTYLVTWFEAKPRLTSSKQINTFQALITTSYNGVNSYAIFNYYKLEWAKSISQANFALAGVNFGDGKRYITLDGSFSKDILKLVNRSNVNEPGRWIYRVDDDDISENKICGSAPKIEKPYTLSPGYFSVGGEQVQLSGLCLDKVKKANVLFDSKISIECKNISTTACNFLIPLNVKIGQIKIELRIDDDKVFETIIDVVKERGLSDFPYTDYLSTRFIKPYYDMSSESINLYFLPKFQNPLRKFDLYLIEKDKHSLVKSQMQQSMEIKSTDIDGFKPNFDVELIYFALSFWSPGNLKYEKIVPIFVTKNVENADTECKTWHQEQPDPAPIMQKLPPCPPNILRPFPDFFQNFVQDLCNPSNPSLCSLLHSAAKACYKSKVAVKVAVKAVSYQAGQQCCYDSNGILLVGPGGGGSLDLKHSLEIDTEHLTLDIYPFFRCCILSKNCNMYYEKRPSDNGDRWVPSSFGGVSGDPHFTTFDGVVYTFNGFGEYYLFQIKDIDFSVQIKTARVVRLADGAESQGTAVIGIDIQGNNMHPVQISIEENELSMKVNKEKINFSNPPEFNGFRIVESDQNKIELSYDIGINFEVFSTNNKKCLALLASVSQLHSNKTTGLLGNFNGNSSDDFILPDGSVLDLKPDKDREIFENFGLKWAVDKSSRVFSDSFVAEPKRNAEYVPKFMQDGIKFASPESEKLAKDKCGNNNNCLFDVSLTDDLEIAELNVRLKSMIESYDKINNKASEKSTESDKSTTQLSLTKSTLNQNIPRSTKSFANFHKGFKASNFLLSLMAIYFSF